MVFQYANVNLNIYFLYNSFSKSINQIIIALKNICKKNLLKKSQTFENFVEFV